VTQDDGQIYSCMGGYGWGRKAAEQCVELGDEMMRRIACFGGYECFLAIMADITGNELHFLAALIVCLT
jgi:hypothetical protein